MVEWKPARRGAARPPLPRLATKRENAESLERDLLSAGVPLIINAANIFLAARRQQRQTSQDSEIMTRYHVAINRQGNYSHGRVSVRACVSA